LPVARRLAVFPGQAGLTDLAAHPCRSVRKERSTNSIRIFFGLYEREPLDKLKAYTVILQEYLKLQGWAKPEDNPP
jgi:hypothetical protein